MITLDSQHVSQLQRGPSDVADRLRDRLRRSNEPIRLTIITPYEQLKSCLGKVHGATRPADQLAYFALLKDLLDYYADDWRGRILGFDQRAAAVYQSFPPQLVRRIGPQDCRIAAITISQGAMLLSANLGDFGQVPGLRVEDWLRA